MYPLAQGTEPNALRDFFRDFFSRMVPLQFFVILRQNECLRALDMAPTWAGPGLLFLEPVFLLKSDCQSRVVQTKAPNLHSPKRHSQRRYNAKCLCNV